MKSMALLRSASSSLSDWTSEVGVWYRCWSSNTHCERGDMGRVQVVHGLPVPPHNSLPAVAVAASAIGNTSTGVQPAFPSLLPER